MFEDRYKRNGIITSEQQAELATKKVAVIGCGGLGGYVIEMLARLGVGKLVVCDGDVFDESNLNRQILCTAKNLGENKADEARLRACNINSDIEVIPISKPLKPDIAYALMVYHNPDVVIDAVDSPATKIMLEQTCEKIGIPFIHGAINGWFGQVATVMPGDKTVSKIYGENNITSDDTLGNPSFTPASIASIQVSEALKVLLEIGEPLQSKVMMVDLFSNEITMMTVE